MTKPLMYPAKLRVTFKQQMLPYVLIDGTYTSPGVTYPLGFAHVYEPHLKSFAKKQDTQDSWAYGDMCGYFYDENGKVWSNTYTWERNAEGKAKQVFTPKMVEDYLQPRIIDNVPLEGFILQKSVSRYSTSNKLWRVLDPRGFELEISTANLEEILLNGLVDHGVITGACVWHTGKILERV